MTKKLKKTTAFLSAVAMVMAMLLYFPSGMFSNIDWGLKASAEGETQTENWIAFAAQNSQAVQVQKVTHIRLQQLNSLPILHSR